MSDTQRIYAPPLCSVSHFIYYHAKCYYAECHYAECRYAECRGANKNLQFFLYFEGLVNSLYGHLMMVAQ